MGDYGMVNNGYYMTNDTHMNRSGGILVRTEPAAMDLFTKLQYNPLPW